MARLKATVIPYRDPTIRIEEKTGEITSQAGTGEEAAIDLTVVIVATGRKSRGRIVRTKIKKSVKTKIKKVKKTTKGTDHGAGIRREARERSLKKRKTVNVLLRLHHVGTKRVLVTDTQDQALVPFTN